MKWISIVVAVLLSHQVFADDVYLGDPIYGGTGCPAGSASAVLSPDAKTLSILFDQYVAQAGASAGVRLDRKSCNLAIPVHVPQGYSVSVFQVDYRGFASVPAGALGRFSVEYFFAASQGPRGSRNIYGPKTDDFLITHNLIADALVWSKCGEDVNLRINSSIMAQTNRRMDDTLLTVDSADVKTAMVYHIQWRRCH